MRKIAGVLSFMLAAGLSVDAVACRVAPRLEQRLAHYEAEFTSADQIVLGDVTALLEQAAFTYRVELSNVRALRGTAPSEMTIETDVVVSGCMPTFADQLAGIDLEPVVVLLRGDQPLSIYELDTEYARSVIARLEQNQE